jgi:hypothetical protein
MPVCPCERVDRRTGNARTEADVGSTMVVMGHPFPQDSPKVPFVQQDQPIQTLTTDRADQPLAKRVRLRAAHRRFQPCQAHRVNGAVNGRRPDAHLGTTALSRQIT